MREPWLALALVALAGCVSPETANDLERRWQNPTLEPDCAPDRTSFESFHRTWGNNVTALEVGMENESREIPNGTQEWNALERESLRALYHVKANRKESASPEAPLLARDHVRIDIRAPSGMWLPRAYECGQRYDFDYAILILDDPGNVRRCMAGMCGASHSTADWDGLNVAAEAAFRAAPSPT